MPQIVNPTPSVIQHRKIFGTLDILPKDISFESQNRGEKVFIKTRPHPLVNIGWVLNLAFFAVLPFLIIIILNALPVRINYESLIPSNYVLLIIGLFYYSILFSFFLFNFVDWYYDLYLVTNERILNIEFEPIKSHKISEANLRNIEDVSETVIGFLPGIFNYGNVTVQTAARQDLFVFKAVPDPNWFRDVIVDLSRYSRGGRK